MVTWLDPHNIDVYTTGAWHLDYNFVDRGPDVRQALHSGVDALLKEGITNNPKIWDLYFELGWTHYNKKLKDYEKALEYIEKACKLDGFDPNTGEQASRPEFVDRMLAHQYEKVGQFKDAIKQWDKCQAADIEQMQNEGQADAYADQSSLDVCDRNLCLLYCGMAWRYGDMDAYEKGVEIVQRLAADKDAPRGCRWQPPSAPPRTTPAGWPRTTRRAMPPSRSIPGSR